MSKANPDMEQVEAYRAQAGDGEVVMINLLKFKSAEAWQRFREEFPRITGPILAEVGAETLFAGPAGPEFIAGTENWDTAAAVRYPNFESFLAVLHHPEWSGAPRQLRDDTIADSRLILCNRMA